MASPSESPPPGGFPASQSCEKIPLVDKAKILFFAMGGGESGFVTQAGFANSLSRLGVYFSDERAEEIFYKIHRFGERQPEGCTYSDVLRISTIYPTLFNVLTCRVIDYNMNARQLGIISEEEAALETFRERSDELIAKNVAAKDAVDAKRGAMDGYEQQMQKLEGDIQTKREELQVAHKQTIASKQHLSNALVTLSEKQQEERREVLAAGVEDQRAAIHKSKTDLERVEREADDTAAAIEQLEKQLTHLKEELFLKRKCVFQMQDELTENERCLQQTLDGLSTRSEVKQASENAEAAKDELESAQQTECDLASDLKACLHGLSEAKAGHEQAGQEAAEAGVQLEAQTYETVLAENEFLNKKSKVDELKAANQKFNMLRDRQYLEEADLVEEEIRLREQREKLEFQEQQLRNEVTRVTPQFEPRTAMQPFPGGYAQSPSPVESATPTQRSLHYNTLPVPASVLATPASVPTKADSIPRAKQTDRATTHAGQSPSIP